MSACRASQSSHILMFLQKLRVVVPEDFMLLYTLDLNSSKYAVAKFMHGLEFVFRVPLSQMGHKCGQKAYYYHMDKSQSFEITRDTVIQTTIK